MTKHKIPIVKNLPGVGEGYQDHVMSIVGPVLINSSISLHIDEIASPGTVLEYVFKGTGNSCRSGLFSKK